MAATTDDASSDAATANATLQRTPLFEAARDAGGRMVPFAGWEMAVQFAGLVQEHQAVRQRCGLFDISHMGVLRLRGANAKDALQGLVPTDLFRIGPGEACYSVLLNAEGGVRDDLIVYDAGWQDDAQTHELLLVINAACAEGYAFPTNLDRDPPLGGLAPASQADIMRKALAEGLSPSDFGASLRAHAARRLT
mgnify:CR=1 FL=1